MLQSELNETTISSDKLNAYQKAIYDVHDLFTLRIGDVSTTAKDLVSKVGCGLFVTPCNPYGVKVSDWENAQLLDKFTMYLDSLNMVYLPSVGYSENYAWSEKSFFVLGESDELKKNIFSEYGQDAYVHVDKNGFVSLVMNPSFM